MALIDELKERREAVAEKLEAAYLSVAHLRADIDDLDAAIDALTPIPAEDTVNAIESLPGFVSWTNDENPELFEASVAREQLETDHALPPSADDVVTDLQGDTVEEMREAFEDVFETQAAPIPQPEWNEPQPEGYAPVVTPEAKMFSHGIQSEQKPDPRDWPFSHLFTGKPKVDA
jgi:hypothetical protein